GGDRLVLRRRRPPRRLLGERSETVGHRRRRADRGGGRRPDHEHGGRAVHVTWWTRAGRERTPAPRDARRDREVSSRPCSAADDVIPRRDNRHRIATIPGPFRPRFWHLSCYLYSQRSALCVV